jgi:protein SCO1/2
MNLKRTAFIIFTTLLSLTARLIILPVPIAWSTERPIELQGIDIQEHLGRQLPIDSLHFRNEADQPVALASYFNHEKPILLTLVYYQCPMLCNLVLNGVVESMRQLDWSLSKDFEMITLSINPTETAELALKKKSGYLSRYDRKGAQNGWHFLTGSQEAITSLADQIGFKYRYDPEIKQYLHAAAIFILTPEGKVSRYLYGTSFQSQNLKLALLEAASGKISPSTLDRILLFCFHFDPNKNSYTLRVWRIVQGVLFIQVLVLALLMRTLWKKDKDPTTL